MFLVCFLLDSVVLVAFSVGAFGFPVLIAATRPSFGVTTGSPRRLTVELLSVWLVIYLLVDLMFL